MSMGNGERLRRARKAAEKAARPFLGRWIVVFYDEADPDGTPVMEANNPKDLAMEAGEMLVIVGAAAGSRPQRSSSSVGLGLSIVIVFFYYVILSFCQSLGEASYLPAVVAAWFPNLVFLVLGGFLVRRAN